MATITKRAESINDKAETLAGFRKIGTDVSLSLVHAVMWNPETKECIRVTVDDYDYTYPDGPFMAESIRKYGLAEVECIRGASIDAVALRDFNVHHNVAFVGAEVEVTRGRKIPIGTKGHITRIRDIHDRYGRQVATYADIDGADGERHSTSVTNLMVIG